jgi:1-pyrroline-5-carboxylate dehydrogenase
MAPKPIDRAILLGEFPQSDAALVDQAVEPLVPHFGVARPGLAAPRSSCRAAADILEERKWDLSVACLVEVGKSRLEAVGEGRDRPHPPFAARWSARMALRGVGPGASSAERCRVVFRPYGAFCVIAPFNFPVALSVGMVSAALVAGNTVVFKPSDAAGLTGRLVVDALVDSGLPEGVLNLVYGGEETGRALVNHPRFDGFAFTGSNAVGMTILRHAASSTAMRPVLCEMGGKNPAIIMQSADLGSRLRGSRAGVRLSGQKCSAASKAYVARAIFDDFLELSSRRPTGSWSAIRAGRTFHGSGDRPGGA